MVLEDKVAIITGSSRGIGKAIALTMAQAGANIVINYYPGMEAEAQGVAEEVEALGRKAMIFGADVTNSEQVDAMVDAVIKKFGQIDILVNNAGITRDTLLLRMKEADWDAVLNTNLKGVFICTKAVARPMMKQRSGKIVNISSVIGLMGNAGQSNYGAAKAGILGFTKSIARELASRGITVNAIAPGFIQTEMTNVLPEEVKTKMAEQIPLSRLGDPEDIANAAVFLASSRAGYITGQTLAVDGGMVMA